MRKPISWALVVVCCAALMIAVLSYRNWIEEQIVLLGGEEATLTVTLSQRRAESEELRLQIKRAGTDADIEEKARSEYGYMKEGELRFEFTNPELLDAYTDEEMAILQREISP